MTVSDFQIKQTNKLNTSGTISDLKMTLRGEDEIAILSYKGFYFGKLDPDTYTI